MPTFSTDPVPPWAKTPMCFARSTSARFSRFRSTLPRRSPVSPPRDCWQTRVLEVESREGAMRNGLAWCLVLQALLLPGLAIGQASAPVELTTRIALAKVDGRMDHMGVDVMGKRLF